MAINLKALGDGIPYEELIPLLKSIFADVEDQLNSRANIYVSTDGKVPTNLTRNDLLVVATQGVMQIFIKSSKDFLKLTAKMLGGLTANGANFKGFIVDTGSISLTHLPNVGDFAFYTNSAGPTYFLAANFAGTIKKVALT